MFDYKLKFELKIVTNLLLVVQNDAQMTFTTAKVTNSDVSLKGAKLKYKSSLYLILVSYFR